MPLLWPHRQDKRRRWKCPIRNKGDVLFRPELRGSSRVCQAYSRRRTLPTNEVCTALSCLFTMQLQLLEYFRLVLTRD